MHEEDALGYLLGLEGAALLRAFGGGFDVRFTADRIDEIRCLLADPALADAKVAVRHVDPAEGYRAWAARYDDPGNAAFADEAALRDLLDPVPPGAALDAACGTGRLTALLAELGHRVTGVDTAPEMLERARKAVPGSEFRAGTLAALPVPGAAFDLVVCGLALGHVPDLGPVYAEFARVLRPGGHLVISEVHPEAVARGSVPAVRLGDGTPARIRTHHHRVGDHLRAALAAGLVVEYCAEPRLPAPPAAPARFPIDPGPWEAWPWSLAAAVPAAAAAAGRDAPAFLLWRFRR